MLELIDLHKSYVDGHSGARCAVADGLSLRVAAGVVVAILGPSGEGKSTLLRLIAGLEPLASGRVCLDAQDITHWPPERRRMALMFQDFALFPHLNVTDNVAFGLREQGMTKPQARAQALDWLARLGLSERAQAPVLQLSGGQQQRVALARALITQPRALLLDEPFAALDSAWRKALRQEVVQQVQARQLPCILVTHDEAEAQAMATQAWRLSSGRLYPLW